MGYKLSWSLVSSATAYKLQYSVDGGDYIDLTTTTNNYYDLSGISAGGDYVLSVISQATGYTDSDRATIEYKPRSVSYTLTNCNASLQKTVTQYGATFPSFSISPASGYNFGTGATYSVYNGTTPVTLTVSDGIIAVPEFIVGGAVTVTVSAIQTVSGQPLSNLPTGAKVKFGSYQVNSETAQPVIWTVVAKNHSGYPTNAITLHTAGIIDLRCFDAAEPNNTNSERRGYGNNRYSVANIDQWLNSNAAANAWYSAQHTYDQSPDTSDRCGDYGTQYAARPGFLNLFTTAEQNAILTTTLRVVKPDVDGGSYEDITRKVFFPSKTEVGLANENNIAEGSTWGYYTSDAQRKAYLTQQAFSNSPSSSKPSAVTSPQYWWLRTPLYSSTISARYVDVNGSWGSNNAYRGDRGVRPALNLSSSLLVSDSTDSDGCYTFV